MHDPNILAFCIRAPWFLAFCIRAPWFRRDKHFASGRYHTALVNIWHHDPERDGSDDSCGWSSPRLTKHQREMMRSLAQGEAHQPWYQWAHAKQLASPADAETLARQAIFVVAKYLSLRVSLREANEWAADLLGNPQDNIRGALCFIPGWHSNHDQDNPSDREEHAVRLFFTVARHILRERRSWWQHPRWHVHHWRIQVPLLQSLKRFLFSRCCRCGGRFRWGTAVCSGSWFGTGPRWFRSEANVYHMECKTP